MDNSGFWCDSLLIGTRHEKYMYLLRAKFPYIYFDSFGDIKPLPEGRKYTKESRSLVKKHSDELKVKTDEELKQLYEQELESESNIRHEAEKEAEAKLFFNLPEAKADMKYWVVMEWLSLDEAVALTFGKDPRVVTLEKIKSVKNQNHLFVMKYIGFMEQAQRKFYKHKSYPTLSLSEKAVREGYALANKHLVTFVDLTVFLCWAVPIIDVNPDLLQEKGTYIKNATTVQGLQKLLAGLKKQIEDLEEKNRVQAEHSEQEDVDQRSEKSYQNIIGSLIEAMCAHGAGGTPNSRFNNQASIVSYITNNNENVYGLSKRNLDAKFAESIQSIESARRKNK